MFKVIGIITMVIVIVVLGGCAATMISLGNEVNKADEQAQEFASVRDQISLGMTESEVLVIAGEPRDTSETTSSYQGIDGTVTTVTKYAYYGLLSTDSWQLVYENGELRSINRG